MPDTRKEFMPASTIMSSTLKRSKDKKTLKRALEIAAAGGHNVIFIGPPGAGITMSAKRMSGVLIPLSLHDALETTKPIVLQVN